MIKNFINKIIRGYWKRKATKVCKNYSEPLKIIYPMPWNFWRYSNEII